MEKIQGDAGKSLEQLSVVLTQSERKVLDDLWLALAQTRVIKPGLPLPRKLKQSDVYFFYGFLTGIKKKSPAIKTLYKKFNEAIKSTISFKRFEMQIKPSLEKEWERYKRKNEKYAYSAVVVEAAQRVGAALDGGKSPSKAWKEAEDLDLTGFQGGCMAQAIVHFHLRGEEFKEYWNAEFGSLCKV